MTVRMIASGKVKGKKYIIYYESMNLSRPYVLVKGTHVTNAKVVGTYKSMKNLLKANPHIRRKK